MPKVSIYMKDAEGRLSAEDSRDCERLPVFGETLAFGETGPYYRVEGVIHHLYEGETQGAVIVTETSCPELDSLIGEASPSGAADDDRVVLVIDDDPDVARMLKLWMEYQGLVAEVFTQVHDDILNRIADLRPQAIVLDVCMPGLDGGSVAHLIRSDQELRHTPMVMYSALSEEELGKTADECHVDKYICKTEGPTAVVNSVCALLNIRPRPLPKTNRKS